MVLRLLAKVMWMFTIYAIFRKNTEDTFRNDFLKMINNIIFLRPKTSF